MVRGSNMADGMALERELTTWQEMKLVQIRGLKKVRRPFCDFLMLDLRHGLHYGPREIKIIIYNIVRGFSKSQTTPQVALADLCTPLFLQHEAIDVGEGFVKFDISGVSMCHQCPPCPRFQILFSLSFNDAPIKPPARIMTYEKPGTRLKFIHKFDSKTGRQLVHHGPVTQSEMV